MIRNKSNGRCRVKCVPGKTTRSRKSGRCRKINSPKRKSRSRKSSKRKSRSRKSSARKSRPRKPPCTKPNQTRSRTSGRCRVPKCKSGMVRRKIDNKCHVKCRPGQIIGPTGRCIKKPKKVTSSVGSGGSGSSGLGSGGSGGSGSSGSGSGGFGGSGGVTSRGFVGSGSGGSGGSGSGVSGIFGRSGTALSRFFTLPTSKSSSSADADDSAIKIWAATGDPFPATPSGYTPPPGLPKKLDSPAHSRSSAERSSSTSWPGLADHLKLIRGPSGTLRAWDMRTGSFIGDSIE